MKVFKYPPPESLLVHGFAGVVETRNQARLAVFFCGIQRLQLREVLHFKIQILAPGA